MNLAEAGPHGLLAIMPMTYCLIRLRACRNSAGMLLIPGGKATHAPPPLSQATSRVWKQSAMKEQKIQYFPATVSGSGVEKNSLLFGFHEDSQSTL